jgi:hypothetical protein
MVIKMTISNSSKGIPNTKYAPNFDMNMDPPPPLDLCLWNRLLLYHFVLHCENFVMHGKLQMKLSNLDPKFRGFTTS